VIATTDGLDCLVLNLAADTLSPLYNAAFDILVGHFDINMYIIFFTHTHTHTHTQTYVDIDWLSNWKFEVRC
jgi:hypothetical protein